MCALSTSGWIWIWLSKGRGGMDSQQINSCFSHMHNHNFLRPYFGQWKLENMNLQLDALSGSLSKVHKQTGRQTGSVVGYSNIHTRTHTHWAVWALQLKVFRLVFDAYCVVGTAITIREKRSSAVSAKVASCCKKYCILCGCSRNTQLWPCRLKPVIGPGQVAASKRFSSPVLSLSLFHQWTFCPFNCPRHAKIYHLHSERGH